MLSASGCGAIVNIDKIPVLLETRKLCGALGINPLRLISSGCMLMTCKDGGKVVEAIHKQGIPAAVIGKVKEGNILALRNGVPTELMPQERDEIYKVINKYEEKQK